MLAYSRYFGEYTIKPLSAEIPGSMYGDCMGLSSINDLEIHRHLKD